MSCFVLKADSIRKIAYTIADVLNQCYCNGETRITTAAAMAADLPKTFSRYFSRVRWYNGEAIAEDLHRINEYAYCTRYNMDANAHVAPIAGKPEDLSLSRRAEYGKHGEIVRPWHYELCGLLDCWLYQTEEDSTATNEMRLSLKRFSDCLKSGIVQHSETWSKAFIDA